MLCAAQKGIEMQNDAERYANIADGLARIEEEMPHVSFLPSIMAFRNLSEEYANRADEPQTDIEELLEKVRSL